MSTTTDPQLTAGTWQIDPAHSSVEFSVRHLMISKVRGRFSSFQGDVVIAEDHLASKVDATIDTASIDTRDETRDGHLRSPDFFDAEKFPTITFRSTSVQAKSADSYTVVGDLTVKGVTRPVQLDLEFNGVGADPWGNQRAGFTATGELSRKEFDVSFDVPTEGTGVVVGDKIKVELEVEAVLQK